METVAECQAVTELRRCSAPGSLTTVYCSRRVLGDRSGIDGRFENFSWSLDSTVSFFGSQVVSHEFDRGELQDVPCLQAEIAIYLLVLRACLTYP